jgi:hypothetical protein
MRILPDYNCIYIHIPKTAGNSIAEALDTLPATAVFDLPDTGLYDPDIELPDIHRPKHIKAHELRSAIGQEAWEQFFTFAFVRNPWDLMVSSYNWWLQKASKWPAYQPIVAEIREMDGFTGFMASRLGARQINEMEGNISDWITDRSGNILMDYVARFEALEESWDVICDRMDVPLIPLPHENKSERSHYRTYYNQVTRQQIADRFSWSIEKFGYTF